MMKEMISVPQIEQITATIVERELFLEGGVEVTGERVFWETLGVF